MELRIFPLISTNISSICNIYLNHRHKKHYYYFSYVASLEDLHKSLKDCPLTFDSNFYIFYPNENSTISVDEVFRITTDSQKLQRISLASYDSLNNRIIRTSSGNQWDRRNDLHGLILNAELMPFSPYVIFDEKFKSESQDNTRGIFVDIVELLSERMNFTMNKTKCPVSNYELAIDRVGKTGIDMSIGTYSITSGRAKKVDFSFPIFQNKYKLFYPLREQKIHWDGFLKPFHPDTWAMVTVYIFVSSALIALIVHVVCDSVFQPTTTTFSGISEKKFVNLNIRTLSFSILSTMGKRFPIEPHTVSGRMAFLLISIIGFVIISVYRAMLGASLSIIKIRHPVNSMDDVLVSDYKIATVAGTSMEYYFKNQTDEILKSIEKKKLILVNSSSTGDALRTIIDTHPKTLAFFDYFQPTSVPGLICRLSSVDEDYMSHGIGLAFRKNWLYTKLFNHNILRLHENGTINRLISSWQKRKTRCEPPGYEASNLYQSFTLYVLLLSGLALSGLVFLVEMSYRHMESTNENT
jgi:ABC-type amino acid transport substrate-binding protein